MLNNFQSYEKINSEITAGTALYYIAYCDNNAAGYCAIKPEENQIFLSKLYVKNNYRQLGVGKNMINHIIKKFGDKEYIYLTVNRHNEASINAYKKMGFVIADSVVNDIGQGYFMDDYVMRLLLTNRKEYVEACSEPVVLTIKY